MKFTIETDDPVEIEQLVCAKRMAHVLFEIRSYFRDEINYLRDKIESGDKIRSDDVSDEIRIYLEEFRDQLFEFVIDNSGIDIDRLNGA